MKRDKERESERGERDGEVAEHITANMIKFCINK